MDSYRIQLLLHILAVIVGLGVPFAYPFLQAFGERNGVAATRFALRSIERVENFVVYPGAVLVFLFGLGLIFDDQTGYKDDFPAWLTVAVTWFVIAFAVSFFVQRRNVKRALEALEGVPDGPALPAAYEPIGKQMQIVGGLLGLSIVGITFLMVWGTEGGF